MWRMLRALFSGFKGKVRSHGSLSPAFEILQGVIQGSRLGPLLFNFFFKTLIDKISSLPGAKLSFGLSISILCYADDCILLANTKKDLQVLLNACFTHSLQNGYAFAPTKCKVMVFHVPQKELRPVFLGNHTLELVQAYKYLGIVFESAHQNYKQYLDSILQKILVRSTQLKAIGMDKDGLRATTAIKLYKSLVRPLIDYAAQVLHFNKQTLDSLESAQLKFLKNALGLEITTSSGAVRQLTGIVPIEVRAAQLKLKYLERITDRPNSIILPILAHNAGPKRGFVKEVQEIHESWGTQEIELTYEKIRKIEKQSFLADLALLRRNANRFALISQYSQAEQGNQTYQHNNILQLLDRVERKTRGHFLQFLLGQNTLFRSDNCEKCGFTYNRERIETSPPLHLLMKCPHFHKERTTLLNKTKNSLLTHFRALAQEFQESVAGNGVKAATILLGCDAATFNISGKIDTLYRKHQPRKKGKHTAQQIKDIPVDTARFIGSIFSEHQLE